MFISRSAPRRQRGFTLVELLVVIAIIGILVALLLPAVQAAREAARRMSCGNNMKQMGLALHNYHDTYKTFPPDGIWFGNPKGRNSAAGDQRHYTWIAMILPFLEQGPLHDSINFKIPAAVGTTEQRINGVPVREITFDTLICPSDPDYAQPPHGWGVTSYAGALGWDHHRRRHGDNRLAGVFSLMDPTRIRDIIDGTSSTVMVGEVSLPGRGPRNQRWSGGSGRVRAGNNRVFRTSLVAPSSWVTNHGWVLAAQQGAILDFKGATAPQGRWTVGHSAPYAHKPSFASHWPINTEWPGAASMHPGGAQFTLADGSVRMIAETITTGDSRHDAWGRYGNVWAAANDIQGIDDQAIVELP